MKEKQALKTIHVHVYSLVLIESSNKSLHIYIPVSTFEKKKIKEK